MQIGIFIFKGNQVLQKWNIVVKHPKCSEQHKVMVFEVRVVGFMYLKGIIIVILQLKAELPSFECQ